ncbi:hypothetical protein Cabys_520 [Caldithrix abyssi DSM 13497]|uniref:Uncharacterized protein n=1 Tax=Caldithrix abyssi DSM 13497 TaxID=880073 RepID=A0A1J1C3P4_CALAY|nr:hypothetical protein Cabys_520 [Caldithrix abyssi DSM 13497]
MGFASFTKWCCSVHFKPSLHFGANLIPKDETVATNMTPFQG